MEERNYSVYIHEFPDGKYYVGLTKQSLEARWQNGDGYKSQPVYDAILNFGWNSINHYSIDDLTREEAQELEKELIKKYNSVDNGYNISEGGGCGGSPWIEYKYNGKIYNPEELARLSPISEMTGHDITNRVNYHGWSIEDALNTPLIHKNQTVNYNGIEYTYKELADMSSVDDLLPSDINFRLKRGWDIERALTQPKNVKLQPFGIGEKIYEYDGEMLNSYELWQRRKCKELKQSVIVGRINQHGWSVEDAITIPPKKYGLLYEYQGKLYNTKELAQIYPQNHLENHDITDRLRAGWSVEDAVEKPKVSQKKYLYNGKEMSLQQIHKLMPSPKVGYTTFWKRVKNGMGFEEASKK